MSSTSGLEIFEELPRILDDPRRLTQAAELFEQLKRPPGLQVMKGYRFWLVVSNIFYFPEYMG
jgi:hypothetical protein